MSLIPESRDVPRRNRFPWAALATVAVAIAIVVAAAIVVGGWKATARAPDPRTIDGLGIAKRQVTAERVAWDLTANARGRDRAAALREVAIASERLRTFLDKHGIRPDEIEVFATSCEAETDAFGGRYDAMTGTSETLTTDFLATQKLTVHSTDIARVVQAFRAATRTEVLADSDLGEPTCSLADDDAVRRTLLAAARTDVRADAERALEKVGGAQLGALVSTSGTFELDPGASSSLESCEHGLAAVATVHATYHLE